MYKNVAWHQIVLLASPNIFVLCSSWNMKIVAPQLPRLNLQYKDIKSTFPHRIQYQEFSMHSQSCKKNLLIVISVEYSDWHTLKYMSLNNTIIIVDCIVSSELTQCREINSIYLAYLYLQNSYITVDYVVHGH